MPLTMRRTLPWCAELPEELFDHYVLFPRVNDEDLSFHRQHFSEALLHRVHAMDTMEERILEVNRWCHENASYQSQDDRTASPWTVYANGSGRCGEESAFLVAALRSVGIAARQVYSPRWAHCDDNHAWVEALCNGQWRFLGACEPEPILDRGWFNTAAVPPPFWCIRGFSAPEIIRSTVRPSAGRTEFPGLTRRTAMPKRRRCTSMWTRDGLPAAGAKLELQVLNEATYYTVATLIADSQGCAEISLGQGDLHVLATQKWPCGRKPTGVGGPDGIGADVAPGAGSRVGHHGCAGAPGCSPAGRVAGCSGGRPGERRSSSGAPRCGRTGWRSSIRRAPEDGPRETLYRTARSNAAALRTFFGEGIPTPLRQAMVGDADG